MMKELTVKNIENEGIVKMYTLQFSDANLSEFENLSNDSKIPVN